MKTAGNTVREIDPFELQVRLAEGELDADRAAWPGGERVNQRWMRQARGLVGFATRKCERPPKQTAERGVIRKPGHCPRR
jgi:hypothetical protein